MARVFTIKELRLTIFDNLSQMEVNHKHCHGELTCEDPTFEWTMDGIISVFSWFSG